MKTPQLGSALVPIPIATTAAGTSSDPGTTGIPGSPPPTDVDSALAALYDLIASLAPIVLREIDGSPSLTPIEIDVPNDSLDVAGSIATLAYAMRRGGTRGALDARSVSGAIT